MPPRKSAKKASTTASSTKKESAAAIARRVKQEEAAAATAAWIEQNDALLDRCSAAGETPITIDYLFEAKLAHKSFNPRNGAQTGQSLPFDWSNFRHVLESRNAMSPRWFVQLREEDLLLGPDGLDGVTVDCFVVAEPSVPTLAPAEYVVKEHWPYSDAEDNAPERVLPLAGQGMCWRRVVKNDLSDINVFLLQRRTDPSSAAAAAAASAATASSFGFGVTTKPADASTTTTAGSSSSPAAGLSTTASSSTTSATGFGFGFGTSPAPAAPAVAVAPTGFGFGFGTTAPAPAPASAAPAGFSFGFAATAPAPTSAAVAAPAQAPSLSFGTTPAAVAPTESVSQTALDDPAVRVKPLKTTEVLFSLWAKPRLAEMAKEVKSGSRIVRPGFELRDPTTHAVDSKIKLVMDNDLHDKVEKTAVDLILNRLFAKSDGEVKEMDTWIEACPVYDEDLTSALQDFRKRYLDELANESDSFAEMKQKYLDAITRELERIVVIRKASAQIELDRIAAIQELLKTHKLAEKSSFRLLKYYAKNDVLPFRPFGKVSGISESGEAVDVCEPPAHVNINPFTGKPM